VGRISAQIDTLHLEQFHDRTGFWGMLEAEDHPETFRALLHTAETWLQQQGMNRLRGPFNFSINEECGLLVEGFHSPPMIMMGHAPSYYATQVEALGHHGRMDTLAYQIDAGFETPPFMQRVMDRMGTGVRIRPLRRFDFERDVALLRDIFNDAWSDNWGFLPFTEAEFNQIAQALKWFVDDAFVQIAEVNGTPAAMIVAFPNINEAIRDCNGRLFPFGWLKLLWRLKITHPKTARIPLMGVRKQFQRTPLGIALAYLLINALRVPGAKHGVETVELSWILETNTAMRNILQSLGAIPYKRYRIYEKELA